MKLNDFMEILRHEIHSVVLATNDKDGRPATSYMDVMHADETGVYFMTSKGKDIYDRMTNSDYVALSGMTGTDFFHSKMFSLRGRMKNIGPDRVQEMFDKNPYMLNIYPTTENRDVISVFHIYEGQGEYTDFSVSPPLRQTFSFGETEFQKSGYQIGDSCIGCGTCVQKCPAHCIDEGTPFHIREENCLHCGNCYYHCPQNAVLKYGKEINS